MRSFFPRGHAKKSKCPSCREMVGVLKSGALEPHGIRGWTNIGVAGTRYQCKMSGKYPARPIQRAA